MEKEFIAHMTSVVKSAERVLLVHGRRSYRACGAEDMITPLVREKVVAEFFDFSENPKMVDVNRGVSLINDVKPDVIVAVGGGSVIDMAKLIRHFSETPSAFLAAIPTTAGTGSEATSFAVCYIDGVKHSIADPHMLPNESMLYPPFTFGNSRYLTSCTGFDALAQAIEAYWNVNATEQSDHYAVQAIELIFPTLPKNELTGNDRKKLLIGANLAGRAINITKTTIPHALSYVLTSKYGYPHGHAVALTFPFFLKYNLEGSRDRFRANDFDGYARKMGHLRQMINVDTLDPFEEMKRYIASLGLGFDSSRDFDDMIVAEGINYERAKNTPIAIDQDTILLAVKSIRENY